jgi:hypothetical protein
MSTEYGAGLLRHITKSKPVWAPHSSDLEAVCWFVSVGMSLTVVFCALGYAESIGQALAISG